MRNIRDGVHGSTRVTVAPEYQRRGFGDVVRMVAVSITRLRAATSHRLV